MWRVAYVRGSWRSVPPAPPLALRGHHGPCGAQTDPRDLSPSPWPTAPFSFRSANGTRSAGVFPDPRPLAHLGRGWVPVKPGAWESCLARGTSPEGGYAKVASSSLHLDHTPAAGAPCSCADPSLQPGSSGSLAALRGRVREVPGGPGPEDGHTQNRELETLSQTRLKSQGSAGSHGSVHFAVSLSNPPLPGSLPCLLP